MFRIATFNLENLDEDQTDRDGNVKQPSFLKRATTLRPALERMQADIICFQEVHGQEREGQPRDVLALRELLKGTRYEGYHLISTKKKSEPEVFDQRNLVTAVSPDLEVISVEQINGERVPNPLYKRTIANDEEAKPLQWERPLLYCVVQTTDGKALHILNVHFKSKLATRAPNLMRDRFSWKTAAGWAEGFFVSSMKRVGAALEARVVIDEIFESDKNAAIVIAGDFNATSDEVPILAVQGRVQETGNEELTGRVMLPLENNIPASNRHTLFYHGKGEMIDHILVSQSLVQCFVKTEIHNEALQDESIAFATDKKFPASDHAPVVVEFNEGLLTRNLIS